MRWFASLVLVVALGVMGCSETSGTGGSAGDGGSGGDGGDGGSGATATLSVFLFESLVEGGIQPLEGARLCETDTTNCATTDAAGNAAIRLQVGDEISYTIEKPGYVKGLRADILAIEGSYVPSSVSTDVQMEARFEPLMSPYPMQGTGTILAQAFSDKLGVQPISGATFELVGSAGKAFYVDDDGGWTRDLTTTTSEGSGGFVEVGPGEHELRVGGAVQSCEVLRGWPSDSANTMRVPVRAGFMTITRFFCPEG